RIVVGPKQTGLISWRVAGHQSQSRARARSSFRVRFRPVKTWAYLERLEKRRLLAFGNTDVSFGDDGRAVTLMPDSSAPPEVQDLCISAGGIIAGGDQGLVRYTASGTIDPTFGSGGEVPFSGVSF